MSFGFINRFGFGQISSGGILPPVDLDSGLMAHYLLNNNASDSFGSNDGTTTGMVNFRGDSVAALSGSINIPSIGAVSASYWEDSGTGWIFIYTTSVPTSLTVINYSNLRLYSNTKDIGFQAALENEGYYPKVLIAPTTVGLIAHYPLTGTAEDVTGNYDGTEISGLSYIDNTEFGSVASFDGLTGAIDLGNIPLSDDMQMVGGGSFSFWMGVNFTGNSFKRILDKSDGGNSQNGYSFYIDNATGILITAVSNSSTISVLSTTTDLSAYDGEIIHLFITINDGVDIDIVVNDSPTIVDKAITGGSVTNASTNMSIGTWNHDVGRVFNDILHSLRIYNRSLTAQEITDIYNYEKNFRSIDIDDGLIAYYPLANNSLDNHYNELDGIDSAGITYDGTKATIPISDSFIFPVTVGFVEAYYTKDDVVTRTTNESSLNSLDDCTLAQVRKYNKTLSPEQQKVIGYTA